MSPENLENISRTKVWLNLLMKRKVYVSLNLVCEVVSAIHHFIRVFSLSFVLIFFHFFLSFFLSFFLLFLLQNYSKNDISTWNFQLFCQSSLGKSICLGLVAELLISFFLAYVDKVFGNLKKEMQIFQIFKYFRCFPVFALSYRGNSKRRKRRTTQSTLLEKQINKCHGLKLSFR